MVTRARSNALPEGMEYPDTGCHVSPSCLACPLPRCVFDTPGRTRARIRVETRDVAVRKLRDSGATVPSIVSQTGMSRRTVYRVLRVTGGLRVPR